LKNSVKKQRKRKRWEERKTDSKSKPLTGLAQELNQFESRAAEVFYERKCDQAIAYELDERIREAAKVLSEMVNNREERSHEFADLYTRLINDCGEIFGLRNLAQKSFLMFRALTEAIEFLAHYHAMLYVFGSSPSVSLDAILDIVLRKYKDRENNDQADTIGHRKLIASVAQALVETIGEISNGMEDIWRENRPNTLAEHKAMLAMFQKAESVAAAYLSTGKRLAPRYHGQISKYFRMMVRRKAGSLRYLSSQIDRLEDRIQRLEDRKK